MEIDGEGNTYLYKSKHRRTPSHTLTANLRQEAAKFRGNIEHARKSDAYVFKKFQDHQQFIVKLSGTQVPFHMLLLTMNSKMSYLFFLPLPILKEQGHKSCKLSNNL